MRRNLGLFEFASQQDPDVFQNLGKIDYKDERYAEFIMPQKVDESTDPVEKLKAFLAGNRDVVAILFR